MEGSKGAGGADEELVPSVPASVLRGLLREWKGTSPEAARNLENYLQQRRSVVSSRGRSKNSLQVAGRGQDMVPTWDAEASKR